MGRHKCRLVDDQPLVGFVDDHRGCPWAHVGSGSHLHDVVLKPSTPRQQKRGPGEGPLLWIKLAGRDYLAGSVACFAWLGALLVAHRIPRATRSR
jgi:hypothetical protein